MKIRAKIERKKKKITFNDQKKKMFECLSFGFHLLVVVVVVVGMIIKSLCEAFHSSITQMWMIGFYFFG